MLERALKYPYAVPEDDFILVNGAIRQLDDDNILLNRKPVLAVGSNRSPEQLRRKFGQKEIIPVTHARLYNHDVVYSAHVAAYGSIPATLNASPGTIVDIAVTWLSPRQLERMHETEAVGVKYDYAETTGLEIELGDGRSVPSIGCYIGRNGGLNFKGKLVALREIRALGRKYASYDQKSILEYLFSKYCGRGDFERWLMDLITDSKIRQNLSGKISSESIVNILPAFGS
ncbi:MAG: hypothetical protein CMM58_07655 [Rhodospirillaceae bacterium]|nr:hypothetical protein [Rhodospirillaceae bacterium]|tara:strand:- start:175 stop:864 length:690 start_codon:yes stop_codon:yes gene_type:complete